MKTTYAILFLVLIVSQQNLLSQDPEGRYVRETDPLVLDKLEKWQELAGYRTTSNITPFHSKSEYCQGDI